MCPGGGSCTAMRVAGILCVPMIGVKRRQEWSAILWVLILQFSV